MTAAHRIESDQSTEISTESGEMTETVEKAPPQTGQLVPQPHGGAIRWGGTNKGGTGRPKDELRAMLLEIGRDTAAPFLESVLDGDVTVRLVGTCSHCHKDTDITDEWEDQLEDAVGRSVETRIRASEQALKYGLGTQKEVSVQNVRERMERTLELIQRMVEPEAAKALIEAIRPVWS